MTKWIGRKSIVGRAILGSVLPRRGLRSGRARVNRRIGEMRARGHGNLTIGTSVRQHVRSVRLRIRS